MATNLRMLTLVLLCTTQFVLAETLPDPTRPAIDLGASGVDVAPVEPVPQGLQSVIIAPHHRAAIINGETVELGGKVGNARLVEVRENSVVLQGPQGRRVMELFPKVNIRKNGASPQDGGPHDNASGQAHAPEQAVGGVK